jgi:hypothetical protein
MAGLLWMVVFVLVHTGQGAAVKVQEKQPNIVLMLVE